LVIAKDIPHRASPLYSAGMAKPTETEIAARIQEAGKRARTEAEARAARAAKAAPLPHENNGPKGPEPTRYGDWEHKGIASDF
jgi:hypothetical protein